MWFWHHALKLAHLLLPCFYLYIYIYVHSRETELGKCISLLTKKIHHLAWEVRKRTIRKGKFLILQTQTLNTLLCS